jgi:hypothetical protein
MFFCPFCNKNYTTLRGISQHINKQYKLNAKDIIFNSWPDLFRNCLCCSKKIKQYKSDSQSRKFCNKMCEISWRKEKKQSQETINKRIANTDQKKKEKFRQKTMMERYGSLEHSPNPKEKSKKISKALTGIKHTKEHHNKITISKIKNGTIKHTQETKDKISVIVTKALNSPNFDKSKLVSHKKNNYKQGDYKGFYCRSSYEKLFVDFCEEYNIKLSSAENNEFAVNYESDGKIKTYFPDFYLVDFDLVVEIKPISMYDYGDNQIKFIEAKKKYRFEVLTEEEHILNKENWNLLYEHLCLV